MKTKTDDKVLYDASYSDIFFKNFLLGFARGLGGLAVQIVFLLIVYFGFLFFVYPKIAPLVNAFIKAEETMSKMQNPAGLFDSLFKADDTNMKLDTPKLTK